MQGEINQKLVISPSVSAVYAVVVTENTCSSDTSDYVHINAAADNIKNQSAFFIYPNPFTDYFVIETDLKQPNKMLIELFDIDARKLYSQYVDRQIKIDASRFKSGLYYLKITTDKVIYTYKILKIKS